MNDTKIKLGFKDSVKLIGYGLKLIAKMTPAYYPCMFFASLITAGQPLMVLFFSARILNELAGARDISMIILYVALTVGISFVISVIHALLLRETESVGGWELMYARLRLLVSERFAKMDFVYAEDSKINEILARMDTQTRGSGLGMLRLFGIVQSIFQCIFSLIFSALLLAGSLSFGGIGGQWSWVLFVLFGILIVGSYFYRIVEHRMGIKFEENLARGNTVAGFYSEYIGIEHAAKDIRLYNQRPTLAKLMKDGFGSKLWIKYFGFEGRMNGFNIAMLAAAGGALYILSGMGALEGAVPVGNILQSVGAVTAFATAAGMLLALLGSIYNQAIYIKPMREYLTLPDLLVKGTKHVAPDENGNYCLEFKNVSFKYPGTDTYALKNLNMKLDTGKRLAVVGQNGSGKTTMIKLLCRLYDPTEGEILLGGVNIKEFDYGEYIALFSVVFQDHTLFPLQLGQNVAVGEKYDAAKVEEALAGAGFAERLAKMPQGLDTILYKSFDESGTQVSGGEAQKIALARVLLKDSPLVVLDEPTAALDPLAEYEVYTTFDKTIGDKTAVFISHRLSSCRFCDDIAVFDGGELIQRGTHEKLVKNKRGKYHELWTAQAQYYTDTESKTNEDSSVDN